jgi:hypothetical protein
VSEAPSVTDAPAEEEDSILTTATNATATQGKRMGKAKKAPAAKARKTRAKKGEPVEVVVPEPEDADFEVKVDPEPKPTRGKKRKSADQDSNVPAPAIEMGLPAPKRRATRARSSMAEDVSILESTKSDQLEVSKAAGRKGRASIRSTRKASVASVASFRAPVMDDEEIDKALEADLERRVTDDEMEITTTAAVKKPSRSSRAMKADHAMFGVGGINVDDTVIEAELEAMDVDSKPLPKAKGSKAASCCKEGCRSRSSGTSAR